MARTELEQALYPFEGISQALELVPIAARRALDHAGLHVSLEGWRSLGLDDRRRIVLAGAAPEVAAASIAEIAGRARPAPEPTRAAADPDPRAPPEVGGEAFASFRIDPSLWASLGPLDRYALALALRRAVERGDPARMRAVFDGIVRPRLAAATAPLSSHLTASGEVRMVDVAEKQPTVRRAVASAAVRMRPETALRLARGEAPKGEVLATARLAGILAAKRTPEIIPLAHSVALTNVTVDIGVDDAQGLVHVTATTQAIDRTGVEMEALVAASAACLTIYDMLKGIDREMTIVEVKLLEKSGGRSGHFRRGGAR